MNKAGLSSILMAVALLAVGMIAEAQQPTKIPRIGYVSPSGDANNPGPMVEAFRQGLRELAYVEGKNILVEYRYLEGNLDRAPGLVAETRSTQGRCACSRSSTSDPRSQAGDEDDPHCHGDHCRSSRDWASR